MRRGRNLRYGAARLTAPTWLAATAGHCWPPLPRQRCRRRAPRDDLPPRGDGVAVLTLNVPEKMNRMDVEMVLAFEAAVMELRALPPAKLKAAVSQNHEFFCSKRGIPYQKKRGILYQKRGIFSLRCWILQTTRALQQRLDHARIEFYARFFSMHSARAWGDSSILN